MERIHSRDMQTQHMAREAAASLASTPADLLNRGLRRAQSLASRTSRANSDCINNGSINTCEKPANSSDETLNVLIGIGIGAAVCVILMLVFLHMRKQKREKAEEISDPHELSDYGLDAPTTVGAGGKSGKKGGANGGLQPPPQEHRLSAQQLMEEAQNPFGMEAELSETASIKGGGSPPKYPGTAKTKM